MLIISVEIMRTIDESEMQKNNKRKKRERKEQGEQKLEQKGET